MKLPNVEGLGPTKRGKEEKKKREEDLEPCSLLEVERQWLPRVLVGIDLLFHLLYSLLVQSWLPTSRLPDFQPHHHDYQHQYQDQYHVLTRSPTPRLLC